MGGKPKSERPSQVRNLTGVPVTLRSSTGRWLVLGPEAAQARVTPAVEQVDSLSLDAGEVPLVRATYGPVSGLPEPEPDSWLIVSRSVLQACPGRADLITPTDSALDAAGQITGTLAAPWFRPMTTDSAPTHLVVLAGGQASPNLQAIVTVRPAHVTVITSPKSESIANRIRSACQALDFQPKVKIAKVQDANDHGEVARVLERLDGGWALCYSGGTKVMATTARYLFDRLGDGRSHHAFIADGRLRRDDDTETPLGAGVNIRAIAKLQGHRLTSGHGPRVHLDDVSRIGTQLRKRARAKQPSNPLAITPGSLPPKTSKAARALLTRKGGWWLEHLVAAATERHGDEVLSNTVLRVNGVRPDAPELDVLVRTGWQIALFSCTLETTRARRKLKLFEARHRADQLAGSRSLAALVCLGTDQQVENLQQDSFEAANDGEDTRVFGRSDVFRWINGDTAALRRFLESRLEFD